MPRLSMLSAHNFEISKKYLCCTHSFVHLHRVRIPSVLHKKATPCRVLLFLAFTFIIDAGVFHPFARHCLAFALFNQLSSHFDSLISSNSMEFELCGCNYNLLNDPTWSASLRGVSGSVITIIHCFFISVNYNSDIFLNSSRFNSFLNSSSVGI